MHIFLVICHNGDEAVIIAENDNEAINVFMNEHEKRGISAATAMKYETSDMGVASADFSAKRQDTAQFILSRIDW